MFIKPHFSKPKSTNVLVSSSRRVFYTFIIGSTMMLGLSGCGQKGDLYLVDSSSQTVQESTDKIDSTSNPQDAAFASVDDDDYQKTRYLEQQQVLPEPSTDINDY